MSRQGFLHGFRSAEAKDEWLTPPEIIQALGTFDLDPCSPVNRPWPTAVHHLTVVDDGLMHEWNGRVWMNPPYGDETGVWLNRLADHGNGVALVFARTETAWFFEYVWKRAAAVFFFRGRVSFYHVNGDQGDAAGAPSCLVAYGAANVIALRQSGIAGITVELDNPKNTEE